MSAVLAVLASGANGLASVLQRRAARDQPAAENLNWRLIWGLLHRPVWFGGVLSLTAGFLLQAAALGNGQLALVEPILVLELPATLLLAARVFHSRLRVREWGAAVVITGALVLLLYALSPSSGRTGNVPWRAWLGGGLANLLVIGVGVFWARRAASKGSRRAAILGATTGCAFGLTAALMKGMTVTFRGGLVSLLTSWQVYAMIASGVGAMFLLQSAVHAGRLLAAQPGMTLCDPLVSVLWGVLVFDERVRMGFFLVLALGAAAGIGAAVVVLAHSPLLSGQGHGHEEDDDRSKLDGPAPGSEAPPEVSP